MRRRISLYIGEALVDLDDESFILFNYTAEDLTNPTVVRNSYSQQITLKGTPNNNRIFGDLFRLDRFTNVTSSGIGAGFNPSKKTPFTIYNELGEILESGYVKLDEVARNGVTVEYKVTLYGGLGAFLYGLFYDEGGNKRALDSLDYLDGGDDELTFRMTKEAVQAAWNNLRNPVVGSIWSVINFAPAYNGVPGDKFDASKGIINPEDIGLRRTVIQDDEEYTPTANGYALVNMAQDYDEWAVKDLRSYLQRPALSVEAFMNAIQEPGNNGGYTFNIDNPELFANKWITLPKISQLKTAPAQALTFNVESRDAQGVGLLMEGEINEDVPFGANVHWEIDTGLMLSTVQAWTYDNVYTAYDNFTSYIGSVIFMQAVGYDENGVIVGGSQVKTFFVKDNAILASLLRVTGYAPRFSDMLIVYEAVQKYWGLEYERDENDLYSLENTLQFSFDAPNVKRVNLFIDSYVIGETEGGLPELEQSDTLRVYYGSQYSNVHGISLDIASVKAYYIESVTGSNALMTKERLLQTSYTPADLLLYLAKAFGMVFTFDSASKVVTLQPRDYFFWDEAVDLSGMVDTSRGVSVVPFSFVSKWYNLGLPIVENESAEDYQQAYGVDYGVQRINTGYEFDAAEVDLLQGIDFRSAVPRLKNTPYMNVIRDAVGQYIPSPFIDQGVTVTRRNSEGKTNEEDYALPGSLSVEYFNTRNGYDYQAAVKMDFSDAENKGVDGDMVLVGFNGVWQRYEGMKLSDDMVDMATLNKGKACWLLEEGAGLDVPIFNTVKISGGAIVESLDFGRVRELYIPDLTYSPFADVTLYERRWRKYLLDRYDVNSKVLTCHVHFDGMQVNEALLRNFYWYDNAYWALNAIRNHSLTTDDPTECEFVQIQDMENYMSGQF